VGQKTVRIPPESGTVEWKQSLGEWKEIVETCAAFATGKGGRIWIGVKNDGSVKGVQIGKGSIEDLANKIAQNTNPRITPVISTLMVSGAVLIVLDTPESASKPVYAFDHPFWRSGNTNQRLSAEEAVRLFMESRSITWDQTVISEARFSDIDADAVRRFLRVGRSERRWSVDSETRAKTVMEQLGLSKKGKLTVAGILLFGRRPQVFLRQSALRCARFKGKTEVHFLDMKVIEGNIVEQVEGAMAFIRRNIRMAAEVHGIQREETWEYPLDALREAIINAICHRDYADSGNVQVRIFDDRLEILNPGGLPEGLTVNDLKRPHPSRPRNKLIANAFFLIKYIEQFGTGIQRILEDCQRHGSPEPEFESTPHFFRVTFRPPPLKVGVEEPTTHEKTALKWIREQERFSRNDYQKVFGVSQRTANRELVSLIQRGLIRRCGGGRHVWYEVSDLLASLDGKQMASNGKQ